VTEYPLALDSNDFLRPWGTVNDNTKNSTWWNEVERKFERKISYMDWGCAGGGLVDESLQRGHVAVGLEGGNYWVKHIDDKHPSAYQWKKYYGINYFNCDISQPFQVLNDGQPMKFDLITAWEVIEHLKEFRLDIFFENLKKHLSDTGFFVGTISTVGDGSPGIELHATIHDQEWWMERLKLHFIVEDYPFVEKVRTDKGSFHIKLRNKNGV